MPRRALPLAILIVALVAGLGLRAVEIVHKVEFGHDETISYLSAAGNEVSYDTAAGGVLTGRWVPASRWQAFLQKGPLLSYLRTRSDLAHDDMHPPLYFWLLHSWVYAIGLSPRSGPLLNVLLCVGTAVALFGLARRTLGDDTEASLVVALWLLSPVAIQITLLARMYELLALLAVLLLLAIVVVTTPGRRLRRLDLVLLAAVTAAGCLTHYHFALVLLAAGLYAVMALWRDRAKLWRVAVACGAGVLAFLVLHPLFYLSVSSQRRAQVVPFSVAQLAWRQAQVVLNLAGFAGLRSSIGGLLARPLAWLLEPLRGHALRAAAAALLGVAVLIAILSIRRVRAFVAGRLVRPGGRLTPIVVFLVVIGGSTVGLYLTFQSAPWEMTARYLATTWPLLAFVPILVARLFGRARTAVAVAFVVVVAASSVHQALTSSTTSRMPAATATAARVLVDTPTRGVLPRVVRHLPPDTLVYARWQRPLLKDTAWLDALRPGDLYVSFTKPESSVAGRGQGSAYGNTPARQRAVLRLLESRFRLTPLGGLPGIDNVTVWRLRPLGPGVDTGG